MSQVLLHLVLNTVNTMLQFYFATTNKSQTISFFPFERYHLTYLVWLWPVCPQTSCHGYPGRAWSFLDPAEPRPAPAFRTDRTPAPSCSPHSEHITVPVSTASSFTHHFSITLKLWFFSSLLWNLFQNIFKLHIHILFSHCGEEICFV